jgi:predicted ATPase
MAQDVSFMSEKGETLALVLHQIHDHSGDGSDNEGFRSKLLNVMRMFVPGFEDWMTEHLIDGRISYKIKEKALKGALPPSLISDGTIRLLTLLTALLYNRDRPSTVFIEEPERSLHPLVMQHLVELMREVSRDFQVIVTTHSPDFARYCRPEEVYFVDKVDGLTQIVRAQDIEQIEQFFQSFTIDQLWLQGYLERGLPM